MWLAWPSLQNCVGCLFLRSLPLAATASPSSFLVRGFSGFDPSMVSAPPRSAADTAFKPSIPVVVFQHSSCSIVVTMHFRQFMQRPLTFGATCTALALSSMFLLRCSGEAPDLSNTENLGSVQQAAAPAISCTTSAICMTGANLPACSDALATFCQSVVHECMYRIKNDPNCLCLENDIRACPLPGGGSGIQTCVTNASKNTTWWDTCHSC